MRYKNQVCATAALILALMFSSAVVNVSANIALTTDSWKLDDDGIRDRTFDHNPGLSSYWDGWNEIEQTNAYSLDCSDTNGWIRSVDRQLWPYAFGNPLYDTDIYSSSGKIYSESLYDASSTTYHGSLHYWEIESPLRVGDYFNLKVLLGTDYTYGKMGYVFVTLFDSTRRTVARVGIRDAWYGTRSDAVAYYYETDEPVASATVIKQGSWSGYLQVYYDPYTGAIRAYILGTDFPLRYSGQFDKDRDICYVAIEFANKKQYNFKSPWVDNIALSTLKMQYDEASLERSSSQYNIPHGEAVSYSAKITTAWMIGELSQTLDMEDEAVEIIFGRDLTFGFMFKTDDGKLAQAGIEYTDSSTGEIKRYYGFWTKNSIADSEEWVNVNIFVPESVTSKFDEDEPIKVLIRISGNSLGVAYVDDVTLSVTDSNPIDEWWWTPPWWYPTQEQEHWASTGLLVDIYGNDYCLTGGYSQIMSIALAIPVFCYGIYHTTDHSGNPYTEYVRVGSIDIDVTPSNGEVTLTGLTETTDSGLTCMTKIDNHDFNENDLIRGVITKNTINAIICSIIEGGIIMTLGEVSGVGIVLFVVDTMLDIVWEEAKVDPTPLILSGDIELNYQNAGLNREAIPSMTFDWKYDLLANTFLNIRAEISFELYDPFEYTWYTYTSIQETAIYFT